MDKLANISAFERLSGISLSQNASQAVFNAEVMPFHRTADGSKQNDGYIYKEAVIVFDDESMAKWTVKYDEGEVASSESELYYQPHNIKFSKAAKFVRKINSIWPSEFYSSIMADRALSQIQEAMIKKMPVTKIPDDELI